MIALTHKVSATDLIPGDHVYVWRKGYTHHGIWDGSDIIDWHNDAPPTLLKRDPDDNYDSQDQEQVQHNAATNSATTTQQWLMAPTLCSFCHDPSRRMKFGKRTLDEFLLGGTLRRVSYSDKWAPMKIPGTSHRMTSLPAVTVVANAHALTLLPSTPYHPLVVNCETAATLCKTGVPISAQVDGPIAKLIKNVHTTAQLCMAIRNERTPSTAPLFEDPIPDTAKFGMLSNEDSTEQNKTHTTSTSGNTTPPKTASAPSPDQLLNSMDNLIASKSDPNKRRSPPLPKTTSAPKSARTLHLHRNEGRSTLQQWTSFGEMQRDYKRMLELACQPHIAIIQSPTSTEAARATALATLLTQDFPECRDLVARWRSGLPLSNEPTTPNVLDVTPKL